MNGRAWWWIAGALALGVPARNAAAARPAEIPRGTVLRVQMPAPSLGKNRRTVRVYLPPSYAAPASASRRFPVILVLHGWPGSDGNWLSFGKANEVADSMIAAGRIPEIIMVFPNGEGAGLLGRSLWINNYNGTSRMEDFIVHDVVAWMDGQFRTRAEPSQRGVIGLSDGATAAFNLVLRHPDVFGACAGHSGQYRLTKQMGEGGVLGPEPGATRLLEASSPALVIDSLAPRVRGRPLYFDVGSDDEDLEDNRAFHRKLQSLNVPHSYNEYPGGHGWGYWRRHLADSLPVVTGRMR